MKRGEGKKKKKKKKGMNGYDFVWKLFLYGNYLSMDLYENYLCMENI